MDTIRRWLKSIDQDKRYRLVGATLSFLLALALIRGFFKLWEWEEFASRAVQTEFNFVLAFLFSTCVFLIPIVLLFMLSWHWLFESG